MYQSKLGRYDDIQLSYSTSTNPTNYLRTPAPQSFSNSFASSVRNLILAIPSKAQTISLLNAFFLEVNWRFGCVLITTIFLGRGLIFLCISVPKEWFYKACDETWWALGKVESTGLEINVHWLCLFFSVLALAPKEESGSCPSYIESDNYFMRSLAARRLAKDAYFSAPSFSPLTSAADGTVLGCLATPLLCSYLAEIGRVSEAWKLLGGTIRAAQAVGMHRDPGWQKWKIMSKDERDLRTTGWWGLIIWDR